MGVAEVREQPGSDKRLQCIARSDEGARPEWAFRYRIDQERTEEYSPGISPPANQQNGQRESAHRLGDAGSDPVLEKEVADMRDQRIKHGHAEHFQQEFRTRLNAWIGHGFYVICAARKFGVCGCTCRAIYSAKVLYY